MLRRRRRRVRQLKAQANVLLATSSGETRALKTKDRNYVNQVIQAINDAMVHRA